MTSLRFALRGLGLLAITLCGVACSSTVALDDADWAPERPQVFSAGCEEQVFHASLQHELEHDVWAQTLLAVSHPITTSEGDTVRIVSANTLVQVGQVVLVQHATHLPIDVASVEPIEIVIDPVDTGLALLFAANLLQQPIETGADGLAVGGERTSPWTVSIAPNEGRTWGTLCGTQHLASSARRTEDAHHTHAYEGHLPPERAQK